MCSARIVFYIFCFNLIVITVCGHVLLNREKKQVRQCNSQTEFSCKSGECISSDLECDGAVDCKDASDETNACQKTKCPTYLFACDYGACIDANKECDGKQDCHDGSDEEISKCHISSMRNSQAIKQSAAPIGVQPGSCIIPEDTSAGKWRATVNSSLEPGSLINSGSFIWLTCNKGYKPEGAITVYCKQGKWEDSLGTCQRTCPNIMSTDILSVSCKYNNKETKNCIEAIEGTIATYKCANFYEDIKNKPRNLCRDGSWDSTQPECSPICGKKTVQATPLIVNGTNAPKSDYPWQVALYRLSDKALICGGTLINTRVIITAAHCVTDDEGKLLPKEDYEIAVGKYYRGHDDNRDKDEAQFSKLSDIKIPKSYRGHTQNYFGDMAILLTETTLILSLTVQPICVDYKSQYENDIYNDQKAKYGWVTGWGYSASSDVLKELKVLPIKRDNCIANLDEDSEKYLTDDKICAGNYSEGIGICHGDGGGSLVFNHDERYYITGILSMISQHSLGGCDTNQVGLYTKVSSHINFLQEIQAKYD